MRFRRRGSAPDESGPTDEAASVGPTDDAADSAAGDDTRRRLGPHDVSEVDDGDDADHGGHDHPRHVDLGSLRLPAREDVEVQLQVDEQTGEVGAVMMVAADGAIELRAFAAPRNGDIWDDARRTMVADITSHGGLTEEQKGAFGTELYAEMTVQNEQGELLRQPTRTLGISGPRWLLRATLLGRPALAYDDAGVLEQALRGIVVVRGKDPMPPGDPLPLRLPPDAAAPPHPFAAE